LCNGFAIENLGWHGFLKLLFKALGWGSL